MRRSDLGTLAAGVACFAGVALVVAAAHASSHADTSPLTPPGHWHALLFVGLVGAFAVYVAACLLSSRARISPAVVGAVAAGVQLVPLAGPMLLSSDARSYTTYGLAHQPYVLHDGWASPSVYGPFWTFVSQPIARLSRPELGFRILAAACTLVIVAGAAALTSNRAASIVFVGWNPLLALHGAGGGHNDALMIALVVMALVLAGRGHPELAGAAWAASTWIKWVGIAFWGLWLIARYRQRRPLGLAGLAVATGAIVIAAFARFGTAWLDRSYVLKESQRTSSLGLLGWLGHAGLGHHNAVICATLVLFAACLGLLLATWRGRAVLGIGGSVLALAQGRLNPWFGFWGVGLAGASEETAGRVLAVALTAVLLFDVLPR